MSDDSSALAGTEVHYLASQCVGDEYKIFIGHCGDDGTTPVPVLYLTDANGMFGLTVDIVRGMQLSRHLPPMVVVGVGYRGGGLAETQAIRTRDLTPSDSPDYAQLFREPPLMGGAEAFSSFIRQELQPWVDGHYCVDPTDAAYFGHSLGGLFGAYLLFTTPQMFGRYILGSPSLWWDDQTIFNLERSYAAAHDNLEATVFFGIGADETREGRQREAANLSERAKTHATAWSMDMVADMKKMVAALRARQYAALTMSETVFPDEFHVSVAPLSLSRGLRAVFGAPR
ncbi:MAG: alpha/beta hydrolase-fold protein [Actinomycetota bacterium]|nr:alpha/beta hydrolase-fold protein [Actinomycetota bacterium]